MDIRRRLFLILIVIFLVIFGGSVGYYFIFTGKYKFVDCLFMTVISVTSVGYGETLPIRENAFAEIYTMVLITFGMSVIVYGLGTLTAVLIEGQLSGLLRKRKMNKLISRLKGHYIVCGGGGRRGHLPAVGQGQPLHHHDGADAQQRGADHQQDDGPEAGAQTRQSRR